MCVEIKSRTSMLAGDGAVLVLSMVSKIEFGRVKQIFDVSMVVIGVLLAFLLLGHLDAVREGTIFAAVFVGPIVKKYNGLFGDMIDGFLINISGEN